MLRNVGGILRGIALITVALSLLACGKISDAQLPNPSNSAVTSTTGYDAVVMVVAPNNSGICTGTFISEKAVLTAAHCLLNNGSYRIVSSFGTFTTAVKVKLGAGVVEDPNDIGLLIFPSAVASREEGQVYDLGEQVSEGEELRLVGFGCNSLNRRGAGEKRTGTNTVASLGDYVEFLTPDASSYSARGIFGPSNRAASCFGDSGGPALAESTDGSVKVVAVTHAGGVYENEVFSQYVNVADRADNRSFLSAQNAAYDLGIQGL